VDLLGGSEIDEANGKFSHPIIAAFSNDSECMWPICDLFKEVLKWLWRRGGRFRRCL